MQRTPEEDAPTVAKALFPKGGGVEEALRLLKTAEAMRFYEPVKELALTGRVLNPDGLSILVSEFHAKARESPRAAQGLVRELLSALGEARAGRYVQVGGWKPDPLQERMGPLAEEGSELAAYLKELGGRDLELALGAGWGGDVTTWDLDKADRPQITTIQHKVLDSGEENAFDKELVKAVSQLAGQNTERALPDSKCVAEIVVPEPASPLQELDAEQWRERVEKVLTVNTFRRRKLYDWVQEVRVSTTTIDLVLAVPGAKVTVASAAVAKVVAETEAGTPKEPAATLEHVEEVGHSDETKDYERFVGERKESVDKRVKEEGDPWDKEFALKLATAQQFVDKGWEDYVPKVAEKEEVKQEKETEEKQEKETEEKDKSDTKVPLSEKGPSANRGASARGGAKTASSSSEAAPKKSEAAQKKAEVAQQKKAQTERKKAADRNPDYKRNLEGARATLKEATQGRQKQRQELEEEWVVNNAESSGLIAKVDFRREFQKRVQQDKKGKRLLELRDKRANFVRGYVTRPDAAADDDVEKGLKEWKENEKQAKNASELEGLEAALDAKYWARPSDTLLEVKFVSEFVAEGKRVDVEGAEASRARGQQKAARQKDRKAVRAEQKDRHAKLKKLLQGRLDTETCDGVFDQIGEVKVGEGNAAKVGQLVEELTEAVETSFALADEGRVDARSLTSTVSNLAKVNNGLQYVGLTAELKELARAASTTKGIVQSGQWYALDLQGERTWEAADLKVRSATKKDGDLAQEVDVSFVQDGVLHATEVAADVETLELKLVSDDKKKQRDSYVKLKADRKAVVTYVIESNRDWEKVFELGARPDQAGLNAPIVRWLAENQVPLVVSGREIQPDKWPEVWGEAQEKRMGK